MTRIICNKVDYITTDNPVSDWIKIESTGKVEYNCETTNEDAGRLKTESVTVRAFHKNTSEITDISYKFFILRLHTDTGTFQVGGTQYPAMLEINSDGVTDTLKFSRKST